MRSMLDWVYCNVHGHQTSNVVHIFNILNLCPCHVFLIYSTYYSTVQYYGLSFFISLLYDHIQRNIKWHDRLGRIAHQISQQQQNNKKQFLFAVSCCCRAPFSLSSVRDKGPRRGD
jgi:hypothetical protein